jgi:hypothetical protein
MQKGWGHVEADLQNVAQITELLRQIRAKKP